MGSNMQILYVGFDVEQAFLLCASTTIAKHFFRDNIDVPEIYRARCRIIVLIVVRCNVRLLIVFNMVVSSLRCYMPQYLCLYDAQTFGL